MSPTAGALQHASLSDAAFSEVRRRIISLQFQPGARLNIDRLAKELGISPTPLREALNRLAAQKLVRVEAYKGFAVEPLLDRVQLTNLTAVRHLLEAYAIESFAAAPDSATLSELRGDVARMEKMVKGRSFDGLSFNDMDHLFHERIIASSRNDLLLDTYRSLNVHVQIARLFHQRAAKHAGEANMEHRELIEALERADVAGSLAALKHHIESGRLRLLSLLDEQG